MLSYCYVHIQLAFSQKEDIWDSPDCMVVLFFSFLSFFQMWKTRTWRYISEADTL